MCSVSFNSHKQMKKTILSLASLALVACAEQAKEFSLGLTEEQFGTAEYDGQQVKLFTIKNAQTGMVAQFTNQGAKLVSLFTPDKDGKMGDVVLGYATAQEYANCDNAKGLGEPFFGATIGRYGNRIAGGKFTVDGEETQVEINEQPGKSLHGGTKGYHSQMFGVKEQTENKIVFTLHDADGTMGYKGNVDVELAYELCDCGGLKLTYTATTDAATPINLTHHSFFNLNGEEGAETINDHILMIPAENITPVDPVLIPTGEFMPVAGTAFDFNTAHAISDSLESNHIQMQYGGGYDHNWVLSSEANEQGLRVAAEVVAPKTGRKMTVLTTEPGVQFYGGNFLNNTQVGKSGKTYPKRSALCLETQHFPDSPNHDNFPSTILRPGETYNHVCIYKFEVVK